MAKYRVYAESISYCHIDIEADSPEEARKFADEYIDGGNFHTEPDGDFEITDVSEIPAEHSTDYNVKEYMEEMER